MKYFQVYIDNFIEYLEFEKRYSKHTLVAYKNDIIQFLEYCQLQYEITELISIDSQITRSWLASLMENKIQPKSIRRKFSSIKMFIGFLIKKSLLVINPTTGISTPKIKKRLPEFIEEHQIKKLFEHLQFTGDIENKMVYLILKLFYCTGIRLSELIHLYQKDIDISNQQIKVLGKGNKNRIIPIPIDLINQLKEYISLQTISNDEGLVFYNQKGKKLNPKTVYNFVHQKLNGITSIHKKSPHILRHSFATHLLNNGAEINAVKELLGHSSLAATQIYTHNSINQLKEVFKNAHPKA